MESVTVKIRRRRHPQEPGYWEEFHVPFVKEMTVISVLRAIQKRPVNFRGEAVVPVVFDCSCLEGKCGSCTMVINGKPKLACSLKVEDLNQPITLEPLTKFPLIKDLSVDRSRMWEDLKRAHAWIPADGNLRLRFGPPPLPSHYEKLNALTDCIRCGACLEVCPEYHPRSSFKGAMVISEIHLLNFSANGGVGKESRLQAMMEEGGVEDCGNAQNCVKACPQGIPLTESIAAVKREVTIEAMKKIFG